MPPPAHHPPAALDAADAQRWLAAARRGDFEEAWRISARILRRHAAQPDWSRPRHEQSIWTGAPLHGKRVLVRCYHGLGDTIQFIRYAPWLRSIARAVVVWAQPPLIPLLGSVDGIDMLLPLHDGVPEADYDADVEVMELPFVFRTTLSSIPRDVPYIHAPIAPLEEQRPRVGLVWRAGDWQAGRSIAFAAVRPLFGCEGISWFSLQQNRQPDERHPALLEGCAGTLEGDAGRMRALDLVITVDSMPAHLAGALGVPVWTLLKKDADWRWMEEREDSPWYPTMRLFRQQREGEWAPVIDRVREELRLLSEGRRAAAARSG